MTGFHGDFLGDYLLITVVFLMLERRAAVKLKGFN